MSTKNVTVTVEASSPRNAVAVAMVKRFGGGCRIMKDRRAPKGGTRNKQRDIPRGSY